MSSVILYNLIKIIQHCRKKSISKPIFILLLYNMYDNEVDFMNRIKNYQEFEEISNKELMVVIAKTKTCVVCNPLTNKLIEFMKSYKSIPSYELYLEDVELFSGQHLVFTVPTILVFSHGKEILRESRFIDFSKIERLFNLYLDN